MSDNNTAKYVMFAVMMILLVGGAAVPLAHVITDSESTHTNTGDRYGWAENGDRNLVLTAVDNGYLLTDNGVSTGIYGYFLPTSDGKGTAPAIGIGVYESYLNADSILVSRTGVTPTASNTMDAFRAYALNNNTDNGESVYQPWNYFHYTAYKMMATTIMGNSDSQYMFGMGKVAGTASPNVTGLTNSAYYKALSSSDSVCLLLENTWGSVWDSIGDAYVSNRTLYAGNTLGGHDINNTITNVVQETVQVPSAVSRGYILTISQASDVFGTPLTSATESATAGGLSINDCVWTANSGLKMLSAGAIWQDADRAGLYALNANNANTWSSPQGGTRLSCYFNDNILAGNGFAYVMTIGNDGVVSDVKVKTDNGLESVMPDGTAINSFWSFDTQTGLGPFDCYYAAVNVYNGTNNDDERQTRLSTDKGEIAYILNPNDLYRTLDGYAFDPSFYNVMLVIPTFYWGSDGNGNLYMTSSPDAFDGVTMDSYAHNYTKSADTGNDGFHSSQEVAYGDGLIVRVTDMGTVEVLDANGITTAGQLSPSTPSVQIDIQGETLYVNGTSYGGIWAYRDDTGDHVRADRPYVASDTKVLAGFYGSAVTDSDTPVNIGYVALGTEVGFDSVSYVYPDSSLTLDTDSVQGTVQHTMESDMFRLDSATFDASWSDDSASQSSTRYFIVPENVTYKNPLSDKEYVNLTLKFAPIFVFLAIIFGIYISLSRRADYY